LAEPPTVALSENLGESSGIELTVMGTAFKLDLQLPRKAPLQHTLDVSIKIDTAIQFRFRSICLLRQAAMHQASFSGEATVVTGPFIGSSF
jgi:hypothetical protein